MDRKLIGLAAVAVAAVSVTGVVAPSAPAEADPSSFTSNWSSVDQHTAAPDWFQDAKFGIFFHWGPYSVPAFGTEWYPRDMYDTNSTTYAHHNSVYGTTAQFPYENFINGGYDKNGNFVKWAPKLTSAGGNFDPAAWAQLFADAGAKFAGPAAEHHDGYSLWDSQVNPWNSVDRGPNLDIVGLLSSAIRAKSLKVMVSDHAAWNYNGFYQYAPTQSTNELKQLYGQLPTSQEDQLWYGKMKELVDGYQPDYIWNDGYLDRVAEQKRLDFLAYYYNSAIAQQKQVVVSYGDSAFNKNGEVFQYERGGPAGLVPRFWLSEDSISPSSWSYVNGMNYYSSKAILDELIDRVSKNGAFLLNIAPMADGTIPQAQKNILLDIGAWLATYGEAVYSTRPWVKFGEGPTQLGGANFIQPLEGTASDIRFTRNKAGDTLYAIAMATPSNNQMVISTLNSNHFDASTLTNVTLNGSPLTWSQDPSGLKVNLPSGLGANGFAVKLKFSSSIPVLGDGQTWYKIRSHTSGKVLNNGGSTAEGGIITQWTDVQSPNLEWQITKLANGYYKVKNHTSGKVLNNQGSLAEGGEIVQWTDVTSPNLEWEITGVGGGWYRFKSHTSGKVLNNQGFLTDGTSIVQWTDVTSPNLEWSVEPAVW